MLGIAGRLVALYVIVALIGRVLERLGLARCGCASDCWCKRPALSAFRWVFPYGHRSAHSHDQDHDHL